jgi:hypothetical protein
MLSQSIPGESVVVPGTYMPPRVKSAYVKLVGNTSDNIYSQNRLDTNGIEEASSFYNSSMIRDSSSSSRVPSARDLVNRKNAQERILELERTNLNLKRMLSFVANDPSRNPIGYQLSSNENNNNNNNNGPHKLLSHRASASNNLLGPPQLRSGRIGSSWRHIKQTNNYTNSNLLFIDGTVRINDSSRYPSSVYGYPPKIIQHREDLIGMTTQSLANLDFPLDSAAAAASKSSRNLNNYQNQFSDRAKQGFEYWTRDKRNPDNNKPKVKPYTTGASKTYYGLSDSLLKL